MATDLFGDSELFSEFDKERDTKNAFIKTDVRQEEGRIVFTLGNDSESEDSDSDVESNTQTENKSKSTNSVSGGDDSSLSAKDILNRCVDVDETLTGSENETSFKILHERNKYARYTKIIDSTRYVPDEDSPALQVIFQNNSFSRKYRPQIEQFIEKLVEEEYRESRYGNRMAELPLQSSVPTCVDLNPKIPVALRTNSMWMAHAIIGCAQFHHLFVIDARGWPLVNLNPNLTDGWEVPVYEQVFEDPLPVDEEDGSKPQGKKASRPKPSCFNCGGDHIMSECKEPKDFNRIRNNRREFLDKNSPATVMKKLSLSANKIEEDKFSKFKPGVLSKELREAMGLRPGQLPLHIYRMRLMGYPPGWLKEAEVNTSGLVMFDGDGREINLHGESLEDGEVNQEEDVPVPEAKIDTNKIVEYPGFTVPVPKDMYDESAKLNMPPIQPHQLKNTLEVIVETTNNERKRKIEEEEEEKAKKFKMENPEVEMELSDDENDDNNKLIGNGEFVPPLPLETPPSRPPPPNSTPPVTPVSRNPRSKQPLSPMDGAPPLPINTPPCLPPLPSDTPPSTPRLSRAGSLARENSQGSTPRSGSPSLETLEEQYQALVQQLGSEEGGEMIVTDSCSGDDPESSATETEVCTDESVRTPVGATMSRTSSVVSLEAADSPMSVKSQDSEITKMNTMVKSTESISREFSTPIMQRPNSFNSLPDASKFGVGVEDHIPFENLPDSTGTFEKMRGLIKLIRSKSTITKKKKK